MLHNPAFYPADTTRKEAERRARAGGAARLEITSGSQRTDAHAFYRACGYSDGTVRFVKDSIALPAWRGLATRAGGADEMVIPHRTGWLVPVGDPEALAQAVAECLRKPEDAGIMAKTGRELAETAFSAEKMIEGTLAVYTRLLDGTGPEEGELPWAT